MEEMSDMSFLDMAIAAGLPRKSMYSIREVSFVTGVAKNTLSEEASAGRITTFLPPGRVRGRLLRPEWVDQWLMSGIRKAVC